MAYKKYIKKGGKIYGPYTYHSKRVDGKVVSEYQGKKRRSYNDYINYVLLSLGIVLVVMLLLMINFSDTSTFNLTPYAVLDLNTSAIDQEEDSVEGDLDVEITVEDLDTSSLDFSGPGLSEDEKMILLEEFGSLTVRSIESMTGEGILIVRNEIGQNWIEYSYDVNSFGDRDSLDLLIEEDRINWLKDIVRGISRTN